MTENQEATRWSMLREELHTRRDARAARKQLIRELSTYSTQADRDDLVAVLDRYDDNETADLRRIIGRQHLAA
jgi:hypothetical protein